MGLDQHRAQIAAEWIDMSTGEVSQSRVAPAHRAAVRYFVERFGGQQLEVALKATTGWRSSSKSCTRWERWCIWLSRRETAARQGNKKRPKNDRADARHLRELLMVGRPPESWIPPDHILDLRARVRLRHTLSQQRGEWQQRIQAVL
jgi:transposase